MLLTTQRKALGLSQPEVAALLDRIRESAIRLADRERPGLQASVTPPVHPHCIDRCGLGPFGPGCFGHSLDEHTAQDGTWDAPTPDETPGASRGVRRWRPFGFVLG